MLPVQFRANTVNDQDARLGKNINESFKEQDVLERTLNMQGTSLRLAWITSDANTELTENSSSLWGKERNVTKKWKILLNIIFPFVQISILEWFLKDHVRLKTGVMMLKIQLCHHRSKLHFKMYSKRILLLKSIILIIVRNIIDFTVYLIK